MKLKLNLKKRIKKLNKHQKLFLGVILVAIPVTGIAGVAVYNHVQNAPVAVNQKIEVSADNNKDTDVDVWAYKTLINPSKNNQGKPVSFQYLFETRVEPVVNKGKKEFKDDNMFERNLIASIQSGNYTDLEQAHSIWLKNSENYNFSTPKNIMTITIARDMIRYDKYLELIKDIPKTNIGSMAKSFGESTQEFNNPVTLAIIANQLPASGQVTAVKDEYSFLSRGNQGGTEYLSTQQYTGTEITTSKTTVPVYYKGEVRQVNKMQEAFNSVPKANSVYEVRQKSSLDGEFISYVVEDTEGKLTLYGNYFLKENKFLESKKSHMSGNDGSETSVGNSEFNWKTFTDQMK